MANELMFQIGIQEVKEKIDDIRKKFDDFEKTYGQNGITVKLNLQGAITEADSLIGALKNIGSAESLKPYENELGKVKQQMEQVANASKTAADANKKASETSADSVNKENIDKQRQLKLLAEVRDMYMKVAETSSATSGVSARTIKETEQQYASLLAKLSTIPPKTPIQEIAAEFSALKSSTKGFFNEIKQGSKAVDSIRLVRLALKQVNEQINSGKSSPKLEGLREQLQAINKEMHNMMKAGNYGGIQSLFAGHKGMSDGVVNMIRQAVSEMNKLGASTQSTAAITSQLTSEEQRLASAIGHSTGEMRGQSQVLSDLKSMAMQYLGVWGAQGFLRNVIEIGGQLEMQRLSIGAILGDMAKAGELFDRIKNLAVKSPFGVVELDQMTKQLSAYGFQYPELYDMTKRLADISAATGTSVDRLALALGHVRSEAALSGYTLRQFSMANIPLAKKLSEHLTEVEGKLVSIAEVRKRVRKKEIGYEDVLQVLKDLTNEGGMFYNAQEIMAESVKAKYKNLKDSMDIMYNEIAESSVGGGLKQVANLLTTLTRHWQELGAVLIAGAGYWAINRVAVMASNKVMVQSNLTMGRFSAAQLEMQATTGNLTRAQLLQAVATKKLAVADVEAAAAVLGLSRAQLQHVANTGKVSSAMNMATISTSKYTISQLRLLATMRSMNLGWLANGWLLLSNGIKAAGVAALGFMKAMWPMLAISAIVEVFMSMKRESEAFADAANYVGQSARNMMKDIDDAMKSVTKNGKPVDTESLREAVNTMKSVLEQSEFYTAEQQKQVEKAVTLSEKYDILLKQMKEMKEEAEWQTDNESLVEKILKNTGKNIRTNTSGNYNSQTGEYEYITSQSFGTPFFNNSLQENIEQVNKSNSQLQSAINLLSEYQGVMEEAIKKNNNFGLSLEGKSWQEQIRLIAESGHWDEFVASVENAGSRFEKTAANVKKASDKVVEDWESIVGDDVKAIRLTLMQEWGMTEYDLNQFAKNNERTMRWLVDSIAKSLSKLGVAEAIIDQFKQKLLELFGVAGSGKPVKKELTEYDKQTDLGKRLMRNVLNYNKNNGKGGNGVTTVKEINEITGTGENQKSVVEVTKALKERAQKSLENMKETKKIYGEASKEYKEAKKKYDHDLNLAESNGIKESEIRSGKYKDKKDKTGDEEAKRLRERVRILKEAADSYQYWREKVGDAAASAHMQDEFGQLLTEQNLQLKNADELKAKLQELRAEYSKKPQTKAMVEAIKEIDKELAQLDRKDFEKDVDKFASKVQIELDSLTRAWEVFNNVREATGNVELAVQLSGADYSNGKTRNLADALREKIQKDFDESGGGIAFDINLSDKDIEDKIKAAVPAASEKQIKGLVDEYKKWRDLQRDVLKNDLDMFYKLIGSAVDLQSQLQKVTDEYAKQIAALDELKKSGKITNGQYNQAKAIADANLQMKTVQAKKEYQFLMDGVVTMTKESARTIKEEYVNALKRQLAAGVITAKEYADKIDEVNNRMKELETQDSDGMAYMKGGFDGLLNNMRRRGMSMSEQGAYDYRTGSMMKYNGQYLRDANMLSGDFNSFMQGVHMMNEGGQLQEAGQGMMDLGSNIGQFADGMGQTIDQVSAIVHLIDGLVQGFKAMMDEIYEYSKSSGYEVDEGDEGRVFLNAFSGASGKATSAFESLKSGDMGGLLAGVVGSFTEWGTAFNRGHDARRDKEIQIAEEELKELRNIDNRLDTQISRALGGGMTAEIDDRTLRRFMANTSSISSDADERLYGYRHGRAALETFDNETLRAMYLAVNNKSAISAQYASLLEQRDQIQKQLDAERNKKDDDEAAIEEYQQQIDELNDQIEHFVEDTAASLWVLDLKGWASQIGDALMTAFENGEDAAQAFDDTVRDIMSDVFKQMMKLGIIEPAMDNLRRKLFGYTDENGSVVSTGTYNAETGRFDEEETLKILGDYFGEGGELSKVIEASEQFYDWAKQITGIDLSSDSSKSTGSSIKGVTESTADILASYLNAVRADVSVDRNMIAQYYPMFYQAMTRGNTSLANIENHTAAIMRSNDEIKQSVSDMYILFIGLKNRTWKIPMA